MNVSPLSNSDPPVLLSPFAGREDCARDTGYILFSYLESGQMLWYTLR